MSTLVAETIVKAQEVFKITVKVESGGLLASFPGRLPLRFFLTAYVTFEPRIQSRKWRGRQPGNKARGLQAHSYGSHPS